MTYKNIKMKKCHVIMLFFRKACIPHSALVKTDKISISTLLRT